MSSWTGCTSTSDANPWNRCTNMSFETALGSEPPPDPPRCRFEVEKRPDRRISATAEAGFQQPAVAIAPVLGAIEADQNRNQVIVGQHEPAFLVAARRVDANAPEDPMGAIGSTRSLAE